MEQSIYDIKINVGYDNTDKPNLSEYDFHPQWITDIKSIPEKYLTWLHIDKFLGNQLHTFNVQSLEHLYSNNESFIYPVVLYTNDLFEKYTTIELPDILLKSIKQSKSKLIFFYITEGWFGSDTQHYNWLNNLSTKYNLQKNDLIIITANLIANEVYDGNKFTILPYNYFADELDFVPIIKKDNSNIKVFKQKYIDFIDSSKIEKHFLCFNGIPRLNRLLMFGTLQTNPKLKDTTISSLRNTNTQNPQCFYDEVVQHTTDTNLIDFYKTYDATKNNSYDTTHWEKIYSWGGFLNDVAHKTTFVNIVTETLWDNKSIFFTEKIYKPMYMCQPFILFGNPNSLKKLKEYGFKTFDKWWDESYDEELDLNIRLEKITKVLEEIASWNFDKCNTIRIEMKDILVHNYTQLLNNNGLCKFYQSLQTSSKNIKKSII
jgi:hypothetical protein